MDREQLLNNERFLVFLSLLKQELEKLQTCQPDQDVRLSHERTELENQCRGWLQSLGNPSLSPAIRNDLEQQYEISQNRIRVITLTLEGRSRQQDQIEELIDSNVIADKLEQLDKILAGDNASATNLMLAQHIEGIYCDENGRVMVRTCKLGAVSGVMDMLPREQGTPDEQTGNGQPVVHRATPRRRARLNVGIAIEDDDFIADANDFGVDPDRFAGLGAEWFYEDEYHVPEKLSWAEEHAREVADHRLATSQSMELTAKHFGKTVPTIRAALRHAKEKFGIDAFGKAVSRSTLPNWSRSNAQLVAEYFQQPNVTMKDAVVHFEKSEPTIRKALLFAKASNEDVTKDNLSQQDNAA